jgi:hypothetical protein
MDLAKAGIGMLNHEKKLKKPGLTPRENMLMAYRHETPPVLPNLFVDAAVMTPAGHIERYEGMEKGLDGWGVEWTYIPDQHSPMPTPGTKVLHDINDWKEAVRFPDLEAIHWDRQLDHDIHMDTIAGFQGKGYQRLKNGKTCLDGNKLGIGLLLNGMFERLHALMGFENALVSLITDSEACFEFFSAVADHKIKFIQKIAGHYPVDVINAHDDYGMTGRMFMSLGTWRELLKPNLKRIVDAAHDEGLIYQHHSCGYIEPLLPEFAEIGVDALDPLQGNCNPNLKALKAEYGKQITFVGGFNNVEVFDRMGVTAKECKAEYRRVVNALAPGGSYIAYPGSLTEFSLMPNFAEHFNLAYRIYK